MPHFARDVVPLKENYQWEFTASSNIETDFVHLNWSLEGIPVDKLLILHDQDANEVVDMLQKNAYSYPAGNTRSFKVIYGSIEYVAQNLEQGQIALGYNYPNPVRLETTIPFSLYGRDQKYNVEIKIIDMFGKTVATPFKGTLDQGTHNIPWTKDEKIRSGIYIYSIEVISENINKALKKRMIIK